MLERLKQKRRTDQGFTLIELLIVIVILAILATIVIFALGSTTKNAAIAACKSTVKTVETAVETYKAQVGTWPANFTVLTTSVNIGTAAPNTTYVGPWLRSAPVANKSGHYTVTLAGTGVVNVTTKTGGGPTNADAATNPCTTA